jgi:hypothetical protein
LAKGWKAARTAVSDRGEQGDAPAGLLGPFLQGRLLVRWLLKSNRRKLKRGVGEKFMRVSLIYKEHVEQHKRPQRITIRSLALFKIDGVRSAVIYRSEDEWNLDDRDSNEAIFFAGQQWVCISQKSIRKHQVTPGFELFRPVIRELDGWSVGETKDVFADSIPSITTAATDEQIVDAYQRAKQGDGKRMT